MNTIFIAHFASQSEVSAKVELCVRGERIACLSKSNLHSSMKVITLCVVVLIGGIVIFAGCRTSRQGYKSAPYVLVRADQKFELRDYPALKIAETSMTEGSGSSFNRLFGFITGRNEGNQKIAMTTPVFMTGNESTMAFVMPEGLRSVPMPADRSVTVKEIPAGRFAVLRYSGERSRAQEEKTLAELKAWMAKNGLPVLSQPLYGYFDPPWTPTFMRRNEVMLRTDPSTK